MNADTGNLENAIELLRSLIERLPSDPRNRFRLLALLYANGRRYDFVVEAHKYRANCDLMFDTDWSRVCEMGREIDPGNEFFGGAPRSQSHGQRSSQSSRTRSKAGTHSAAVRKNTDTDQPPEQETASPETPIQGADRGEFVERRVEDRRKTAVAWIGEERRKYPRRKNKT